MGSAKGIRRMVVAISDVRELKGMAVTVLEIEQTRIRREGINRSVTLEGRGLRRSLSLRLGFASGFTIVASTIF